MPENILILSASFDQTNHGKPISMCICFIMDVHWSLSMMCNETKCAGGYLIIRIFNNSLLCVGSLYASLNSYFKLGFYFHCTAEFIGERTNHSFSGATTSP